MANGNGSNPGGQGNPFGFLNNLDIGQLMNMLNNVDMNQISSLMNSLGINPNNFNPNMGQSSNQNMSQNNYNPNMNPNMDPNTNQNMNQNYNQEMPKNSKGSKRNNRNQQKGSGMDSMVPPQYSEIFNRNLKSYGDKRTEILSAMKPMVDPERAALLDRIIQLYILSKIIRK